jgi:hypothetical protein
MHYILDGQMVRPVDVRRWAKWFETADRIVREDRINGVRVSTVFLGLDAGCGSPELFETMVFGGMLDQRTWRAATWAQAEEHPENPKRTPSDLREGEFNMDALRSLIALSLLSPALASANDLFITSGSMALNPGGGPFVTSGPTFGGFTPKCAD